VGSPRRLQVFRKLRGSPLGGAHPLLGDGSLGFKQRAGRLVRNWAIQSINWYGLTEVVAQVLLEGGFVVLLWVLGLSPWIILAGWLLFHTAAWIFLYGGFMIVWKLLRIETRVARLEAYRDRIGRKVRMEPSLRLVLLRGGAARGKLSERSDIDLLGVPEKSVAMKARGILSWWALRAWAALHRIPIEARWVDAERLVPYHVVGESPIVLKDSREVRDVRRRLATHGLLVAFSGIDGSGKTTAARDLVASLNSKGLRAEYFYGHRPAYLRGGTQISFAIAFKSFWKRTGHSLPDLEKHGWAKMLFDVTTLLDYVYVQWKLSRILRPNTIVVSDRYVADVIAYLRFLGPVKESLAGLLVRYSHEPDIAIFFDISPSAALSRKQEQTPAELEKFMRGYADLRQVLGLAAVDAALSISEVRMRVEEIVMKDLPRFASGSVRASANRA